MTDERQPTTYKRQEESVNNNASGEEDVERGEATSQSGTDSESGRGEDHDIVNWSGSEDPENPMNFPTWRKWIITTVMGLMAFCATFASSVFSSATDVTAKQFRVSPEVTTLGTALFVLVSDISQHVHKHSLTIDC